MWCGDGQKLVEEWSVPRKRGIIKASFRVWRKLDTEAGVEFDSVDSVCRRQYDCLTFALAKHTDEDLPDLDELCAPKQTNKKEKQPQIREADW
eukprot:5481807-Karenia_brevis.AAC.1